MTEVDTWALAALAVMSSLWLSERFIELAGYIHHRVNKDG